MPKPRTKPDVAKPFIVVIDSGAFVGHMGILRARLGDDIVDKTIQYFGRMMVGSPQSSVHVMRQFSKEVKDRKTASGQNPAAVFSCPFFLAEFHRECDEMLPKNEIFILPNLRKDEYCNTDGYLERVWEESEKQGHVFKRRGTDHLDQLFLKDNTTEVVQSLEREILKIYPDIVPKKLSRSEAKEAWFEAEHNALKKWAGSMGSSFGNFL